MVFVSHSCSHSVWTLFPNNLGSMPIWPLRTTLLTILLYFHRSMSPDFYSLQVFLVILNRELFQLPLFPRSLVKHCYLYTSLPSLIANIQYMYHIHYLYTFSLWFDFTANTYLDVVCPFIYLLYLLNSNPVFCWLWVLDCILNLSAYLLIKGNLHLHPAPCLYSWHFVLPIL